MSDISDVRARLEQAKGKLSLHKSDLATERGRLAEIVERAVASTTARIVLQESARLTQEMLQYRIAMLVSLAMESVFDDPYQLALEFQDKYGRTSAELSFVRDDEHLSPLDASGGGAVDVAAFGLQMSLWTLQTPKTRNVLVLDEPLKWLKGGSLPEKGAKMIREISHKLGVQIIMVSHIPDQIEHADKIFHVRKNRGISLIK